MTQLEALTIGHSTLSYEVFSDLLKKHGVTAIADVRSSPVSRHFPQFNRPTLKNRLKEDSIAYVFLGAELGGRPKDRALYSEGVADYEKMAGTKDFQTGIARVIEGAINYRIALMCSEQDPLDCHRCLLVSRSLKSRCVAVQHILPNGRLLSHDEIEDQLLKQLDKTIGLFESRDDSLQRAYRKRAMKIAYRAGSESQSDNPVAAE